MADQISMISRTWSSADDGTAVTSAKGAEVSCTAGISDGSWIRLFPIPYRHLERGSKFSKYDWIDVDVKRSSDSRPESYKVNPDSPGAVSREEKGIDVRMALDMIRLAHEKHYSLAVIVSQDAQELYESVMWGGLRDDLLYNTLTGPQRQGR
ncbi:MAG: NYN domain-containing protein [Proteobacteria bacterium]|nr:NYN domain-containing protein [Pseudomonadota bacterium]